MLKRISLSVIAVILLLVNSLGAIFVLNAQTVYADSNVNADIEGTKSSGWVTATWIDFNKITVEAKIPESTSIKVYDGDKTRTLSSMGSSLNDAAKGTYTLSKDKGKDATGSDAFVYKKSAGSSCSSEVTMAWPKDPGGSHFPSYTTRNISVRMRIRDPAQESKCISTAVFASTFGGTNSMTVKNATNGHIWFNWRDGGALDPVGYVPIWENRKGDDGWTLWKPSSFELVESGVSPPSGYNKVFAGWSTSGHDSDDCKSYIFTNSSDPTKASIKLFRGRQKSECSTNKDLFEIGEVGLGNTDKASAEAGSGVAPTSDDDDPVVSDCDGILPEGWQLANPAAWASNSLDWFICSFAKGISTVLNSLAAVIGRALQTEDISDNAGLKEAWGTFLTIANIIFVIAFLIMVISTALNLGFVDAYTVKKLLPRIIIAIILCNLSYVICSTMIEITNTIGGAVWNIITGIGVNDISFSQDGASTGALLAAAGAGGALVLPSAIAAGGFAILPLLVTALIAIVTGFAVIIIRRIIIVLLIVLAPIAFACWVIPGLDGWAKRWWKLFVEMLMAYPFIMGLLASGWFVASIVPSADPNDPGGDFGFIIRFGAIILPFLLLPAVFKMASSTLGNITGMVNDRSKGIGDRGKNAARERGASTRRSQERDMRKEMGAAERKRGGAHRALRRPQTRWDRAQSRISGGRLGQGLSDADIAVLRAHEAEEAVRQHSAEEKSRNTQRAGHGLRIRDQVNADQSALIGTTNYRTGRPHDASSARDEVLGNLAARATDTSIDQQEYFAIMEELGRQKADNRIGQVQETLSRTATGAERWNAGVADNGVFGAMTSLHTGFGQTVTAGGRSAADTRLSTFLGKNVETRAGDSKDAWLDAATTAAFKLQTVQANPGATAQERQAAQNDFDKIFADFDAVKANDNINARLNVTREDIENVVREIDTPGSVDPPGTPPKERKAKIDPYDPIYSS